MLLTPDTDFVNGMKMTRQDPGYRVFAGNLHRFVTRWSFWLPITDVDCDFRLVRRSIVERVRLTQNSGSICVELVKLAQRAGRAVPRGVGAPLRAASSASRSSFARAASPRPTSTWRACGWS